MDLTQFLCLSWFQAKKRASQTKLNISLSKIGSLGPRHGRSVRKLPVIPLGIRNTLLKCPKAFRLGPEDPVLPTLVYIPVIST